MEYKYFIRKIYQPSPEVVVLELADQLGRPVFGYKPGQYVMIAYANERGLLERKHAFSLASSPTETDHIKLGIKIGGKFTQGLLKLEPGSQVVVNGPFGSFVFDETKHRDAVFLAGGIGITPFYSALKYATERNLDNKMALLYSNKTLDGTLFYREIKALEDKNENLRALFSVTDKNVLPVGANVVNKRLDGAVINGFVGGHEGKTFFICGPAPFMKAMRSDLLGLGVKPSQIEMEGFSMMAGSGVLAGTKNVAYAMGFSGALMLSSFYLIANPGSAPAAGNLEKLGLVDSLLNDYSSIEAQAAGPLALSEESGFPVAAVLNAGTDSSTAPVTETVALALAQGSQKAEAASATAPVSNQRPATGKAAVTAAPAPVTHASPVKETAAAAKPTAAATAASKTSTTAAPAPVTSASAPAHTSPTPVATAPTTQAAASAPAPVTSASAPASSVTTATPSQPAATTPSTAPAPSTSASTPASGTGTSVSSAAPTTAAPATVSRNRHDDDDDD